MKLILYSGLYNNITEKKLNKLIKNRNFSSYAFDFNIAGDVYYPSSKLNIDLFFHINLSTSRTELLKLVSILDELSINVNNIFLTMKYDLHLLFLKKYIRKTNIKFVFQNDDNLDDEAYYMCKSNKGIINHQRVILDDRLVGNGYSIYKCFNKDDKDISILTLDKRYKVH